MKENTDKKLFEPLGFSWDRGAVHPPPRPYKYLQCGFLVLLKTYSRVTQDFRDVVLPLVLLSLINLPFGKV